MLTTFFLTATAAITGKSLHALKKWKMIEIEKNKNGKYFVIKVFILPDDDELIKKPFAY